MKTRINLPFLHLHFLRAAILSSLLCLLAAAVARAGLTLEMNLYHYDNFSGYVFSPYLNTNDTPPDVAFGDYLIVSPQYPANGVSLHYHFDTNGFNLADGSAWCWGDLASILQGLTNGDWSIFVTNAISTNVYYFNVAADIDSNSMPNVVITFPAYGAVNVPNQPTFTWQGPTNYSDVVVYQGSYGVILPATQTSWSSPGVLAPGTNTFTVHYDNYSTTGVVSSLPLDNASNAICSWVSTVHFQDYRTSQFVVGTPTPASGNPHTLIARYDFEQTDSPGVDSSGNGNDSNCDGGDGTILDAFDTDAAVGSYARRFFGDTFICFTPPNGSFYSLSNALSGSFSVSAWVKTTNSVNDDYANAYFGAAILFAYNSNTNSTVPLSITGSKVAITVSDHNGTDTTLHSTTSVNDGQYHQIAVTRNQTDGLMSVYVDGNLEGTATGTTDPLYATSIIDLGGGWYADLTGLLDDVQIYSGVLSPGDVASLFANPGSTIANVSATGGGHTNIVYYSFEDNNLFAHDFSGQGNDIGGYGWFDEPPYMTNYAAAGSYAVGYTGSGWQSPPTNLVATLAGSFSVSLWARTSDDPGNDSDAADSGAGMLSANSDQVIPMAQTGSKLAFLTGGDTPDTLHSATSINSGNYVHLVVTRDQNSGVKKIYVNGTLDASDAGVTGPLSTDSDPTLWLGMNSTYSAGFLGDMDEVQIYTGVLSDAEVAYLYNHPGTTVPDIAGGNSGPDFNGTLGTTNLAWTTSGDTGWFVETTNTYNSAAAAQSGSVTNNQSTTLSVTVTGPCSVTFYWSSIANDPNGGFNHECDLDGGFLDYLYGDTPWSQDGPFTIPAGQHTLTWTVSANGDADPTQAGFLDQVSFVPATLPVITLNPFSQTNYPGYQVCLLADASGSPAPAWQWFMVGDPNPIPNATSALFIPPNSGTPAVAGDYYAVAANLVGSSTSLTATVSFASALPALDWKNVMKSPFSVIDHYYGCALDSAGNIYAAADFSGTNTVGTNILVSGTGGSAAAIVKQTPAGDTLWVQAITNAGNGNAIALNVASAPADGVFVAGNFTGTNWLGTDALVDGGSGSIFLAYFDAGGSNVWLHGLGGTGGLFTVLNCLVSDPAGNVTLSGMFSGTVDFGGNHTLTANGQQPFVAQYNVTGSLNWVIMPSGWFEYLAYGGGRIYGSMMNPSPNVSVGTLSLTTDRRWTLVALNATDGQAVWLDGVGAASGQGGPSVIDDFPAVAVSGSNVFLVGTAYGSSATFGSVAVTNTGSSGQYFARYDTNGTPQLAVGFGSQTTRPWAVAANAAGEVYISGDFDTFSAFGSKIIAATPRESIGSGFFSQAFVAKFDPSGNPLWARPATSSEGGKVNFRGVVPAPDGVWVSGFGKGVITLGSKYIWSNFYIVFLGGGGFGYTVYNDSGVLAKIKDVGTAPVITQDLTNYNIECGSSIYLSVVATNSEPLLYQWYLSGTNPIAGANSTSLSLYDANIAQSGDYSLVVVDAFGSVTSSVATLTVADTTPPVVVLYGAARIVTAWPADFVDPGAVASDTCAGILPVTVYGTVSLVPRTNILTYVATDPSGNSGANTRTVVVVPVTQVQGVSGPLQAVSGQPMQINWSVTNLGSANFNGTFHDQVFLSPNAAGSNGTYYATFNFSGVIPAGQAVTLSDFITPDLNLSGNQWIVIVSDANGVTNNTATSANPVNILLKPLPALQVSQVSAPPSAFAGQPVTVTWGVINAGNGGTSVTRWYDGVWLSSDGLADNTATFLGQALNPSSLDSGGSYASSLTVNLPPQITGNYTIVVRADFAHYVTERMRTNDTLASGPIQIQVPPLPELDASITAPAVAFSGQNASISWSVVNAGPGATTVSSWYDVVYLSPTNVMDTNAVLLNYVYHSGTLASGGVYSVTNFQVSLPVGISGNYYFLVVADSGQQVYQLSRERGTASSSPATQVILTPPPDLAVQQVAAPGAIVSAHAFFVTNVVANVGASATPNTYWNDSYYLSPTTNLDLNTAIFLKSYQHYPALQAGQSYTNIVSLTTPNGLAGTYYIFVDADSGNLVFELNKANNIGYAPVPVVSSAPLPDLVVTSLQAPTSVPPGSGAYVSWTVQNRGSIDTAANYWTDTLLLSSNANGTSPITLSYFSHFGPLNPGDSYTATNQYVTIPYGLSFGTYYLFVVTDSGNLVYLGTNSVDRTSAPHAITLLSPTADLSASSVTAPTNVIGGTPIKVGWAVTNLGPGRTYASYWDDSVYLSTNTGDYLSTNPLPLAQDILLGSVRHVGDLTAGTSYTNTLNVQAPGTLNGDFTLYVLSDSAQRVVEDTIRSNNVALATNQLVIQMAPPVLLPDLSVTQVSAPDQAFSSQFFYLTYAVDNTGPGSANGNWYDAVYLSPDPFFDLGSALYLGASFQSRNLGSGQQYTNTAAFTIPPGLSGLYYVFVVADYGNYVPQSVLDNNNVAYAPYAMQVLVPLPADLVVASVQTPANSQVGQATTITYTVSNQGANAAEGSWTDAVYLSTNGQWNANAVLIGYVQHTGTLGAGSNYTGNLFANLPGVTAGDYYIIVRPDVLNNLNENLTASHSGGTANTFSIDVPQLTLDVPRTNNLAQSQQEFFKVLVSAGQTLSVALNSDSASSANRLYVRYGQIPDEVNYDFVRDNPGSSNQRITVPATQAGWYYIMAVADSVSGLVEQVSLEASLLQFSLNSVTPSRGGNAGKVTVQLEGGQFNAQTTAQLLGPGSTVITGTTRNIANSAEMYVTFDLRGATTGLYDVRLTQPASAPVVLSGAFTVTEGLGANLSARLYVPGRVRPGFTYTATLTYENAGDEDMTAPFFVVTNSGSAAMSLTSDGPFGQGMIKVLGIAQDGPAGILSPGSQYSLPIYFQVPETAGAHTKMDFYLSHINPSTDAVDWSVFLPDQAGTLQPDAWAAISANIQQQAGPTMSNFLQSLADNAMFFSQMNQRVSDIVRLYNLELLKAANTLTLSPDLVSRVDDELPSHNLRLSFCRTMPSSLDRRFQIGPFGRGWTHNYQYTLTRLLTNIVDIVPPIGCHRYFLLQTNLIWKALPGDNGVLQDAGGGAFTLQELDGSSSRFDAQGRLALLQDADGNQITFTYSGANLTGISHSDGQQMTLAYNGSGRISSLSDSAGQTTYYYYDAAGEHLTSVVSPGDLTTVYEYVPATGTSADHALQSITWPDGTHRYFTYDNFGQLSSSARDGQAELLRYGYDALGNMYQTNALNAVVTLRRDERGNILQRTDAVGNVMSITRDEFFYAERFTKAGGGTTLFGYDAQERLTSTVDALGHQVTLEYTNLSRLSAIHNQRGVTTKFGYDDHGNLTRVLYPDLTSENLAYDGIGSVTNYLNRRGQVIEYVRNSRGQLDRKKFPDGRVITYLYDRRGFATNISDSLQGVTTLGYDARGFLTNIVSPDSRGFSFTYNDAGKRLRRTGSDGYVLNYNYDTAGRLQSLADGASNQLVHYTYDPVGNLIGETKGNGTTTSYRLDAENRIIALTNYAPNGSVISFFNYAYDADGNRSAMTNLSGVTLYTYDLLDQLTGVTYPGGREVTYSYDAAGNRTAMTDTGTNTSYTANPLDEYTQAGTSTFLYDADGNLTNRTDASGTTTYQYDAENKLLSVTTPNHGTWQYSYDALGRRTTATHDGVTTHYVVDPAMANVAAEYDDGGSLIARYNGALGILSRIDGSGQQAFYSYDALGNTRELTDSTGAVLNYYDYDAFGAATTSNETVPNDFKFVGRFGVAADPTGLHFMKNRYYAADLGRFQSTDPVRWGGGLNLMKYVANNPIIEVDVLGLQGDLGGQAEAKAELGPRPPSQAKPIKTVDISGSVTDGGGVVGGMTISENGVQIYTGTSTGEGNGAAVLFSTSTPTEGYNVAITVAGGPFAGQYSFSGANADQEAKTFIQNLGSSAYNGSSFSGGFYVGTPGVTVSWYYVSPPLDGPVTYAANYWGGMMVDLTPKLMHPSLFFVPDDQPQTEVLISGDPNEKTGPVGYGPNALISASQTIPYTISFVNASSNTAPAHTINITDQLDPSLDPRTFRLTEIVFGTNTVAVPANRSYLQTNLTVSTADGPVIANVIASVDILSGQVFWSLTAIDPATGQSPADPVLGLLPPDDANHAGEGRVSYTVMPYTGLATGTSITNSATITFDINPPITTPAVVNTLDAGTPQSQVTLSNNVTSNNSFVVSWSGTDNNGESGLAGYNIYVSDNGGPFQLWLGNTTLTSATYTGQTGHTYSFYCIAVDNAGNVQATPSQPQTSIFVSTNLPPVILPINNVVVTPDGVVSVKVMATDPNGDQLTYSLASGAPAGAAITVFRGTNLFFHWRPTRAYADTTNLITVVVTDNGVPPLSANQTFAVIVLDYLELILGSTNLEGGQSASIPVYLASNDGVTNLQFTVQVPENLLTNWTLTTTSPQIASGTLQDFITNILISLSTTPGQSLQGTQQISWLSFQATTNQPSSFINLPVISITGIKPDASPYSNYTSEAGSVVMVQDQPLLWPTISSNLAHRLILYGKLSANYELQFTTNLGLPSDWQPLLDYTQTNGVINLELDSSRPAIFYRLLQQ